MDVVETLEICCSGGTAIVPAVVPHGMQIKNWRQGRFYEAPFLEYLKATYRGGTWVDGGSAIGNHTLFFAKFCETRQVISIDPILSSLKIQEQILSINRLREKVFIISAALSDKVSTGYIDHFGPGVGHWRLSERGEPVPTITLDSLELENVQVLKLDIEGSELAALKGAQALLSTQHPAVFTEANSKQEVADIGKFMRQFGYRHRNSFHTMHEWTLCAATR